MRSALIFLLICCLCEVRGLRIKRSDDCFKETDKWSECLNDARNNFTLATRAGNDGRKDWMERKLCNFVTGFVQDCSGMLSDKCSGTKNVTYLMDYQFLGYIANDGSFHPKYKLGGWDYEKCPPVKAHIERMKDDEYKELLKKEMGSSNSRVPEANNADLLKTNVLLLVAWTVGRNIL